MKPRHIILISIALLTLLIPSALSEENIPIDEAHFPDENFRAYVQKYCDNNKDGSLSSEEINEVEGIYLDETYIVSSLSGIEYFTALEFLCCNDNNLTTLDVSSNHALNVLDCRRNNLKSLNVSNCSNLEILYCLHNQLTSLDISSSIELWKFDCSENQLKSLDIRHNYELFDFCCEINQISTLDISNCHFLLEAYNGHIYEEVKTINGTEYPIKQYGFDPHVSCDSAVTLVTSDSDISEKDGILIAGDLFGNRDFRIYLRENFDTNGDNYFSDEERNSVNQINISHKDLFDLYGLEYFPNLTLLSCSDNVLDELDLSGNPQLWYLDCSNNDLSELDVSSNPLLEDLDCSGNSISTLDLSKNPELVYLYCNDNQLTTLNVSQNLLLDDLYCQHNRLETLDITGCPIIMMRLRPEDREVEDGVAAYRCFRTDESVVVNGGAFPAFLDLPVNLTEIGEEAFTGAAMEAVDLSETDVETIGPRAFADCKALRYIEIEDRHTQIADDAFAGCDDLIIVTEEESIEGWANAHGLRCAKIWVGE